jgi:hypothetical protein
VKKIQNVESQNQSSRKLNMIAARAFAFIAEVFPVCAVSDEFYFFPQVVSDVRDWRTWDDFSGASLESVAERLLSFENELLHLSESDMPIDDVVDTRLLTQAICILREHLLQICPQSTQPTFHLTILVSGLLEALAAEEDECWLSRIGDVSAFLRRAAGCLSNVPELFLNLGLEMLGDLQRWVFQLHTNGKSVGELPGALQGFRSALQKIKTVDNYCLREELFEKMLVRHLGCDVGSDVACRVLQEELQTMEVVLAEEAALRAPGMAWTEVEQYIPLVRSSGDDLRRQYLSELASMEGHCRRIGLVPEDLPSSAVLKVAAVPDYLAVVRASDAYSAAPGHPPRGGTFYVMEQTPGRKSCSGRTLEYRMTAAHEGWPGHHLLDSCRWNLDRPLRRPLEAPLFYEGWACLAEELMAQTGYFQEPWDRFLLARRRAERAARGLVDLGLQRGHMTNDQAVQLLVNVGYRAERARSIIPKYLLRPGYQVCYTLGLKQGLDLLEKFGKDNIGEFAQTILRQGEIGFNSLAKILATNRTV